MAIDKHAFAEDTAWIEVVEDNTAKVLKEFPTAINRALEKIGILAEGHVVGYMTRHHIVDTGRLRNSISHTIQGKDAIVGTNVPYGIYVHEGTYKMKGRPYLKQPVQSHSSEYRKALESELKKS